jgi:hypothetical protein
MRALTCLSIFVCCVAGLGQTKPEWASSNAVLNAGGGGAEYAPGSLIYLRGNHLTAKAEVAQAPYPTSLNGTSVSVTQNGVVSNAAILEALVDRLTVQVPYGLKAGTSTVKVKTAGGEISRSLPVSEAAPRPVYQQVGSNMIVEAFHADGRGVTYSVSSAVLVWIEISTVVVVPRLWKSQSRRPAVTTLAGSHAMTCFSVSNRRSSAFNEYLDHVCQQTLL